MATEQERKALQKQKREAAAAKVRAEKAKIAAKQKAKKQAQLAKGKETRANITKSIKNTSAKQARDKADREIAYNKSIAKVKNINKKAGRTLKNDPETNAQTIRSQNTRLGIPNDFSPKKKLVNKAKESGLFAEYYQKVKDNGNYAAIIEQYENGDTFRLEDEIMARILEDYSAKKGFKTGNTFDKIKDLVKQYFVDLANILGFKWSSSNRVCYA